MKTQQEVNYEDLEKLLLEKTWDLLTTREKQAITTEVKGRAGYEAMQRQLHLVYQAISSDVLGFEPDPAIQQRLVKTMELRPKKADKVKKGSFGDIFLLLFSPQNLGMKTALAMVFLMGTIWFGNQSGTTVKQLHMADSVQQYVDTSFNAWEDSTYISTMLFIH